jgi:hypothetical protein
MRRRELIFLRSASADGCNAWRTLPFPLAPIYAIARADSARVTQTTRLMKALLNHYAPRRSVLIRDLGFGLLAIIVVAAASVVAQVATYPSMPASSNHRLIHPTGCSVRSGERFI